jgi:hypothetical protein
MGPNRRLSTLIAVGCIAAHVAAAPAMACFEPDNEGAAVVYVANGSVSGGSTEVDLKLAGGPPANSAIVHPFQLLTNVVGSDDFIGWGTARGEGTVGGITDCPDDYSAGWHVYADGRQFGDYWCRQTYGTLPDVANNQQFKFRYLTCPATGLPRFVMYLNGVQKTCALINSNAGQLAAGGEAIGDNNVTKDIDVDYEALHYYFSGQWYLWSGGHDATCGPSFNNGPYFIITVSNTEFEIRSGI